MQTSGNDVMFETTRPCVVSNAYHAYRRWAVNYLLMTSFYVVICVIIDAIVVAKSINGALVDSDVVSDVDGNIFAATQSPPIIIEGPSQNIIYSVGDRIILPCKARGKPFRFEWYFNGRPMLTSNAPNSERFVEDSATDATLHLKTRTKDTVGYYQCRAINAFGSAMSNVSRLQEAVFEETTRLTRGVIKNVTTAEGRHVVLPCNHYVSFPAATVTWYSVVATDASSSSMSLSWTVVGALTQLVRADERIAIDDRGGLVISNVGKQDELLYKCQAYNYVLRQTSGGSYHRLIVERAPYGTFNRAPELVYASSSMNALAGSDVILTCVFSATPAAQISWSRRAGEMPKSASTFDFNRRLLLRRATSMDGGVYQCTANNSVADTQTIVSLNIDSMPTISESLKSRDVTIGGSTSFECQGHGRPTPEYTWYINTVPIEEFFEHERELLWNVKNGGRHLEMYNVRLVPGFTVTCNVSNSHGHALSTAYAFVLPVTTSFTTSGETETETGASNTEGAEYTTHSDRLVVTTETSNGGILPTSSGGTAFDHPPSTSPSETMTEQRLTESPYDWTAITKTTLTGIQSTRDVMDVETEESAAETAGLHDVIRETPPAMEETSSTHPETDAPWSFIFDFDTMLGTTVENSNNIDYVYDEAVSGGEAALIGSHRVVNDRWRTSPVVVCVVLGLLSVAAVLGIIVCLRLKTKRSTYRVGKLEMKNGRIRQDGLSPEEGKHEEHLKSGSVAAAAATVAAIVPIVTELTPIKTLEEEECHL